MTDIASVLTKRTKILLVQDADHNFGLAMRSQARAIGVDLDQVSDWEDFDETSLDQYSAVVLRTELRRTGDMFYVNRVKKTCGEIPVLVVGDFTGQKLPRHLTLRVRPVNLTGGCDKILRLAQERSKQYKAGLAVQYLI